ncbi:MAG: chemotaxis protein CheW [Pseudomonadota bacterium]
MIADRELLVGFIGEAREHLSTVEEDLLALEKNPEDKEVINKLFRKVHSIKGGAGFFGLDKMGSLSHVMENLLSKVRSGEERLAEGHIDILLGGVDQLKQMVSDPEKSNDCDITDVMTRLESIAGKYEEGNKQTVSAKTLDINSDALLGFEIEEAEIRKVANQGMQIYASTVFLKKDLLDKGKSPFKYIAELECLGRFVDSYLNIDAVKGLKNCVESDLPFTFIFATIMEPDLIPAALEIPEDQVAIIDISSYVAPITINGKNGEQIVIANESGKKQASKAKPSGDITKKTKPTPTCTPVINEPPMETAPARKSQGKAAHVEETLRVHVGLLNRLINLAGELVLGRNQLVRETQPLLRQHPSLLPIIQHIDHITAELQERVMNTRMQPLSVLYGKFPRVVRDLSKQLNKEIDLVMNGDDVELDKTIIESISDPLTHLVRNVVDHAIETPEEREKAGKPRRGTMTLQAYQEAGLVHIDIIDNGKGIDPEIIAQKALEKGVITQDRLDKMSDREKVRLVFIPGFSTKENVSSVSGRGVGMDVVKSNIEKNGGMVNIESVKGEGTSVHMSLPLTLAIISSLIVESAGHHFAFPQVSIEELVRLSVAERKQHIKNVKGKEVLILRGELLPIMYLADVLNIRRTYNDPLTGNISQNRRAKISDRRQSNNTDHDKEDSDNRTSDDRRYEHQEEVIRILSLKVGENRFGIVVDQVVGSEEIVVKPVPQFLRHLTFLAGATIMGDGKVALILDVPGLGTKGGLIFTEAEKLKMEKSAEAYMEQNNDESQRLLLFNNGGEEHFALSLQLIRRVDKVDPKAIESTGDGDYIQYENQAIRIIRLHDHLAIKKPEKPENHDHRQCLILPKLEKTYAGILVENIVDSVECRLKLLEGGPSMRGLVGSAIINNKITLLLNIYELFEMALPDKQQLSRKKAPNKKNRILLAEDTQFYRELEKGYLQSAGYEVTTAEDGAKALDRLEKERFDLVVTDIEMPNMDGWKLLNTIRGITNFSNIPVVALTSLASDDLKNQGLTAGFSRWLVKLDKTEMLKAVHEVLA